MKIAIGFQIAALVLGGLAVIWSVICWSSAASSQGGDWAGLGLLGSLVNVPIGLLILAIGLIVKQGSPRLRVLCIVTSLVALFSPVLVILTSKP
jgi:hypothetical protein